jgi:hypothetical protein
MDHKLQVKMYKMLKIKRRKRRRDLKRKILILWSKLMMTRKKMY